MPIQFTTSQWEVDRILKWREKGKLRIPLHQRGNAWNKDHETALIDTIYRGLPISSITLSSVDLEGKSVHFIEDGCQRIRTLEKFRKNLISFQGGFFTSLPKEIQEEFLNYRVPVLIYSGASEEERIEIFDRLQNGVLLSYGERFHSMRFLSPMIDYSCEILLHEDSPLSKEIELVWGAKLLHEGEDTTSDNRGDGTKRYRNLREAVCLMSGCLWGPAYYSENYNEIRDKIRSKLTEIQKEKALQILRTLLDIYKSVLEKDLGETAVSGKKLKDMFWGPKNFTGYILYSLWYNQNEWASIKKIWFDFLCEYREKPSLFKDQILQIAKGCHGENKYKAGWLSVSDSDRKLKKPIKTREKYHARDDDDEIDEDY